MPTERRVERGIFETATGWRIYVKHLGVLHAKRLPATWSLVKVRKAREDFAAALRREHGAKQKRSPGTLAEDIDRYLAAVASMPSIRTRRYDLGLWRAIFGARRRHTITRPEIDAVLHRWINDGTASATVRHRRSALMHLWHNLDGRDAPNPVRGSFAPADSEIEPRGLPYGLVTAILRRMRPSKTRARLAVIAWTGLAHSQVMRLRPEDVDWDRPLVYVRRRHKGKGSPAFAKPLTDEGLAALQVFARCNAWGRFSTCSAYKSFKLAAGKMWLLVGPGGIRPYDLRHSYGTAVYLASRDIRATQAAMGHGKLETTLRYTIGAVDANLTRAIGAFGNSTSGARFSEKVTGAVPTSD